MMKVGVYVNGRGLGCPFCGSGTIQGSSVEVSEGRTSQEMSCTECNGRWEDIYQLIGFKVIQEGRNMKKAQVTVLNSLN